MFRFSGWGLQEKDKDRERERISVSTHISIPVYLMGMCLYAFFSSILTVDKK